MMDWLLPDFNEGIAPIWPRAPTPPPTTSVTSDTLLADLLSSVDPTLPSSSTSTPPPQQEDVEETKNDFTSTTRTTMTAATGRVPTARETRAIRRREFHKIHTRRSRAKLNDKMDKLLAALPTPPPGVVVKSKAQILDYAVNVLTALSQHPSK